MSSYGASAEVVTLIADYLSFRKQRVKVGSTHSDWNDIVKGVPQGSILGPLIFNIFINDIFHTVNVHGGSLFNYADDNTVLFTGNDLNQLSSLINVTASDLINWCKINQMEANPSKFQILIANEQNSIDFTLNDTTVQSSPSVKLLGVTLDHKLNFNEHVNSLILKASRQLNCLIRLSRTLSTNVKLLLYKSFILSNFNYCPAVWHHCGSTNTKNLERLQYRALKYVFNDFDASYESLLTLSNLPTLHLSRLRFIACEVYKAINQNSPNFIKSMFTKPIHSYSLRSVKSNKLCVQQSTSKIASQSFKIFSVNIWNVLPGEVRMSANFPAFKKLIKNWQGPVCKCSLCNFQSI
jgi:hypothetical protein